MFMAYCSQLLWKDVWSFLITGDKTSIIKDCAATKPHILSREDGLEPDSKHSENYVNECLVNVTWKQVWRIKASLRV